MALPVIKFNSSGSDTAASGAGPATALFGTGAALDADTTISLAADSPDLSGVATDGSAVLWVDASSGRQFFKITGVDNGTKVVTVANAATPTESGRNWGIGGKRATIGNTNSRKLFSADVLPGWIAELESAETISTAITCSVSGDTTNGMITVRGATQITLTQSGNAAHFDGNNFNYWHFENMKLQCTNATRSAAFGINWRGIISVKNMILGDATNKLTSAIRRQAGSLSARIVDCEILYCTSVGVNDSSAANSEYQILGCYVHDNGSHGVQIGPRSVVEDSVIETNSGDGINFSAAPFNVTIQKNTIHANTGDGIDSSTGVGYMFTVNSNNLTANGNYGIRAASGQATHAFADFNNFGTGGLANTSGSVLNLDAGANDLAVDPGYADAANGNFEAGTAVKALGFPKSSRTIGSNQSATNAFVDVGIQREEAGGSSGKPSFGRGTRFRAA